MGLIGTVENAPFQNQGRVEVRAFPGAQKQGTWGTQTSGFNEHF
jgi:hypothetical protein